MATLKTKRWGRGVFLAIAVSLIASLMGPFAANAQLVTATEFEYDDGNLTDETHYDWESAPNLSVGGAPVDPDEAQSKDDDSYKGGAKHDSICPETSTGSIPPNKDDLTTFYVGHELIGSEVFLYISWQRYLAKESSASAHMGFEFNQSETPCAASTKSSNIERTKGDILIMYDLEGSGDPVLSLLTWRTEAGDPGSCLAASSVPCWGNAKDLSAAGFADGSVNDGLVTDPIPDPDVTLPFANQFGEAAVNLTGAGVFDEDECENFGYGLLGSRSSGNSFNSTLKDFVGPIPVDVTNCGSILVNKVDGDDSLLDGATIKLTPADNANDDGDTDGEFDENDTFGDDDEVVTMTEGDDGVFCEDDLFFGDYVVFETVVPAGYSGDLTYHEVTISETSTCAERLGEAGTADDDTADLTITNNAEPGRINLLKEDDDGNPLEGIRFRLFNDDARPRGELTRDDSSTGSTCTTDSDGVCREDGVEGADRPAFDQVDPGFYCVGEIGTSIPAGYAGADPQCFELVLTEGGDTINLEFANPRLHRVIVIVCHEGTDDLYRVPVSDGTDVKRSIGPAALDGLDITGAELCDIGGASFGGKGHERVTTTAGLTVGH